MPVESAPAVRRAVGRFAGEVRPANAANLFDAARRCLDATDPSAKLELTATFSAVFARGELAMDAASPARPIAVPGRPPRPRLVEPRRLARRGLGSDAGRAALVHAVAHIEFNAINLAWDAVYRFRDMPPAYYRDWVAVAADEARHYSMLVARLAELGHAYGDFDAHDGLWTMAARTADSCLARMALVPRVLEARGLDVTPGMIERLRSVGDQATAEILEVILHEEVAHVAAGSRWFTWCCVRDGVDPRTTFRDLLDRFMPGGVRGPFNHGARRRAGFDDDELADLDRFAVCRTGEGA